MTTPIKRLNVSPSYVLGFTFEWEMVGDFAEPLPWIFTLQESQAIDGPWTSCTPGMVNVFRYTDHKRRVVSKNFVLYFRLMLQTGKGTHWSAPVAPYGDSGVREWLLIRDIMRREVLQARTLSGILGQLWIRQVSGMKCPTCRDPITGSITNSDCPACYGVGYTPGYHGPYDAWLTFTPKQLDTTMAGDGTGTRQPVTHEVRMVVAPYAKDGDILIDPRQDKRYYVDNVQVQTEIRRIPIVQTLVAHEAPVTEPIYKLGT